MFVMLQHINYKCFDPADCFLKHNISCQVDVCVQVSVLHQLLAEKTVDLFHVQYVLYIGNQHRRAHHTCSCSGAFGCK